MLEGSVPASRSLPFSERRAGRGRHFSPGETLSPLPPAGSPPVHQYRPEIDGLRALAIVPVVLFHAKVKGVSGGFVGVDIFFVISGYLISSIILADLAAGKFSLARFYERRFRRIFPALFAVALFCIVGAGILFTPAQYDSFGKSLVAMTAFVSNVYFRRIAGNEGYFAGLVENEPLLHTWSLSVEEQFYIFLPMSLLLVSFFRPRLIPALIVAVLVLSFGVSIWAVAVRPPGAFYYLPSRAWELLLGALLATRVLRPLSNRVIRELAGFAGLALIAYSVAFFSKATPFPGLAAAAPCMGAWLLIYSTDGGNSTAKSLLRAWPLVWIGLISYSLYIWHWPLMVFTRVFTLADPSAVQAAALVATSVVVAAASYRWIETPFRRGKSLLTRRQVLWSGALTSAAFSGLGLLIVVTDGFPQRFDPATRAFIESNTARKSDNGYDITADCLNFQKDPRSIEDISTCPIGGTKPVKVQFWGDSHVAQLYFLIQKLQKEGAFGDREVFFTMSAGCPPATSFNNALPKYHCDSFSAVAKARALQPDVDAVFIGFSSWWTVGNGKVCRFENGRCVRSLSESEARQTYLDELRDTIRTLRASGKKVIVALPFPNYDRDIPDLLIHNRLWSGWGSTLQPRNETVPEFAERMRQVASAEGAVVFDPAQSLCRASGCIFERDGVSLYHDSNHLASSQLGVVEDALKDAFR